MAALFLRRDAERLRLLAAGICDLDLRRRLLAIAARLDTQAETEEASVDGPPFPSRIRKARHAE
jgi:hypothetical protein